MPMQESLKITRELFLKMDSNITLEKICDFFRSGTSFALVCHKHPDGDTLGSALALKRGLSYIGKKAQLLCSDLPSANLEFLFDREELPALVPEDKDAVFVSVDVATAELFGELSELCQNKIALKIDHHEMGESFAQLNYTDSKAASCGEIIFKIVKMLGVPLEICAEPLYAAISSDTGGFRYSNTTADTHVAAAELLLSGADNAFIDHMLYESKTKAEIRALTAAYSGMKFFINGKVAVMTITNDDKRRLDLKEEDLGVLNPLTREIMGVQVGLTVKQNKLNPSKFRISVRSGQGFPANKLCALFGGGGHACAAGAELTASSAKNAISAVIKHLSEDSDGRVIIV